MTYRKKLPIGIDNFEKLIQEDFYYVDKTDMIADLLKNWEDTRNLSRLFDRFYRPDNSRSRLPYKKLSVFIKVLQDSLRENIQTVLLKYIKTGYL